MSNHREAVDDIKKAKDALENAALAALRSASFVPEHTECRTLYNPIRHPSPIPRRQAPPGACHF